MQQTHSIICIISIYIYIQCITNANDYTLIWGFCFKTSQLPNRGMNSQQSTKQSIRPAISMDYHTHQPEVFFTNTDNSWVKIEFRAWIRNYIGKTMESSTLSYPSSKAGLTKPTFSLGTDTTSSRELGIIAKFQYQLISVNKKAPGGCSKFISNSDLMKYRYTIYYSLLSNPCECAFGC